MQFHIRAFDPASGSIVERRQEGEDREGVQASLEREGLTVLSLSAAERTRSVRRLQRFDAVLFCEELRTLLSSGMSLVEAIDTLCSKGTGDNKHAILRDLHQRLLDGKQLSSALELNKFPFSPLLVASIRASERSSRIEVALDEYINYETMGRELGRKLISAAIYPSLVVGFGAAVSMFMIAYVVPRFARVYDDYTHALSLPTAILLKLGVFCSDHFVEIALSWLVLLGGLVVLYRNGKLKSIALRILSKSKTARYYLRLYQLARIYQTLSMLLRGGYTLSDAIPLAQNLAFDDQLRERIGLSRERILEGRRLSAALADNGLTDTVTERLLQVGERSGSLAKVMDVIAQNSRQEFTLFLERATRLAEPILLMVVAIMIGLIIVMMYMPIFDLAGGLQGE
jgi:general secretion pathway protein F